MINLVIGIFSIAAAVLWFMSTFDVLYDEKMAEDGWIESTITKKRNGKIYSVFETLKRQTTYNKWAAACAGLAALLQSYGAFMDFLK